MVPGMICCRYKVHGEWRIFRWLCKENNRTQKKANGISDLEDDEERKEFCRETEGRGRQISKRRGSMTKDPVCGIKVDENRGEFHTQFAGKKYFFCSDECMKEFEAEPDAYVETAAA